MAGPRLCSIPDCGKPHHARGFCAVHCSKDRKSNITPPPRGAERRMAHWGEARRFIRDVAMTFEGDDCLFWPFTLSAEGYAVVGGNHVSRMVCETNNGKPPTAKHEASHSCGKGNRGCVSRHHLSWKTKSENQQDRFLHGTHHRGDRNPLSKLDEDKVREIRRLKGMGVGSQKIAQTFGISRASVYSVEAGLTWTWVK